jgi:hypothetical protein
MGRLGEVTEPPPGHPPEGADECGSVEDFVECLVKPVEADHDGTRRS